MIKLSVLGLCYARCVYDQNVEDMSALAGEFHYIKYYADREMDLPAFKWIKKKTLMIHLTGDLGAVFARFNSTTRNEINKTMRSPDLEFRGPDDNREEAYLLYKMAKKLDGAPIEMRMEFKDCKLFNAYLNGVMIASVACWDNGDTLRLKSIVSLRKKSDPVRKLTGCATRRIIWEICKYGKTAGNRRLDLGGINFDETEKVGITRFKQGFGGEIVDVNIYTHTSGIFSFMRGMMRFFGREIP